MASVADLDPREPFEALVESVYVPLQRYLRRRTDAASADDVLGDVLLTMWRRAEDIPADSALAWCYQCRLVRRVAGGRAGWFGDRVAVDGGRVFW